MLFVSGTDCYGSPIMESYRKLREEGYDKSIGAYVQENHDRQEATLDAYDISCDLYACSALEPAAHVHEQVTDEILHRLKDAGVLNKRSTLQFYDTQAGQFLNGRQVVGHCPIQGCKSEKAYADECDLGHQFEPEELHRAHLAAHRHHAGAPSGREPLLRPARVSRLPQTACLRELQCDGVTRSVVTKTMEEWLLPPVLYIQNKFREAFDAIEAELPAHTVEEPEGNKSSFTVVFPSWQERDEAHAVLAKGGVRFRSGKALVPFRITGNIEWGVPVDDSCGCHGLTCWVWPESLWAPISFTRTALAEAERAGKGERYASLDWHDWWCSEDAHAYQFIGQDNIYFYGIAQSALLEGARLQHAAVDARSELPRALHGQEGELFEQDAAPARKRAPGALRRRAAARALPVARTFREAGELLAQGLRPARDGEVTPDGTALLARDDKRVIDPVLKEGTLLTGVFNRLARSCFYGVAEREGDESRVRTGCIPAGIASAAAADAIEQAVLGFEDAMHRFEFHRALGVCDAFLRAANKRWSDASKAAKAAGAEDPARGDDLMKQALVDAFAELRVATVLMHGVVPRGCELICEYFDIAPEVFFELEPRTRNDRRVRARLGRRARQPPREGAAPALRFLRLLTITGSRRTALPR